MDARARGVDLSEENQRAKDDLVRPTFDEIYRSSFAFVWRNVLRLGADPAAVDDLVQETFVVVHRRLPDFEGRAALRTWLFAIVRRVVADHRRTRRRKPTDLTGNLDHLGELAQRPSDEARVEAVDLVNRFLEELDEEKREVFVLAELEEMTMAEIAEVTGVNPNTVSARLRAARKIFQAAVREHDEGGAQ